MVDTILVIVTVISLAAAAMMGLIVWRVLRLEQKRSAGRVAELTAAADEWDAEQTGIRDPEPGPRRDAEPAAPLWTDLVIERTAVSSARRSDDGAAAAHLFRTEDAPEGNGRRLVAGFALAATFVVLAGAIIVSVSTRAASPVAAEAAPPPLELLALEHARTQGRLSIRGVVRNPVARGETRDLVAVLFLFDKEGRYLGTLKHPVVDAVLSPGADSPFEVSVSEQLPVGRYRLTFHSGRSPVPHLDRRVAAPADRPAGPQRVTASSRTSAALSPAVVR